jgi:hypothetical protein
MIAMRTLLRAMRLDMNKPVLMPLIAIVAMLMFWNAGTSLAQQKDCRPGIVQALGDGISEGLAKHSCRIRYKKAVVKKYGADYAHFEFGKTQRMGCGRAGTVYVCECSAQPCR